MPSGLVTSCRACRTGQSNGPYGKKVPTKELSHPEIPFRPNATTGLTAEQFFG